MCSDDDQPIIMEINSGFNSTGELTISADYFDYEEPGYNCSTAVVVNEDDAREMARRHNVKYMDLPVFIAQCMEEWSGLINPNCNQVRECFKEITDALLDEGCRFKLINTYGSNGYTCC